MSGSRIKHGFFSKDKNLNPDMQILQSTAISSDDMVRAEAFLKGTHVRDVITAHETAKLIYHGGKRRYPTLWDLADKYVNGYEYESMEKISQLPTVERTPEE